MVDESQGTSDHGCFQLIREETVDAQLFSKTRRMLRGETSSKREQDNQIGGNERCTRSRLVTPTLSNSLTDTNIFNCNRRLRASVMILKSLDYGELLKK